MRALPLLTTAALAACAGAPPPPIEDELPLEVPETWSTLDEASARDEHGDADTSGGDRE